MSSLPSSKSSVVSIRLKQNQIDRLARLARQQGRSLSDTGAMLIEESLRRSDFAWIEFRDSALGRRAYIQGSSLTVWEVIVLAKTYGMDAEETADHLRWPIFKVEAAINYWKAYPNEIDLEIKDSQSYDLQALQRMLPQMEIMTLPSGKPHKLSSAKGATKLRSAKGVKRMTNSAARQKRKK